jgi:undecaprenyl diphosphate synthase
MLSEAANRSPHAAAPVDAAAVSAAPQPRNPPPQHVAIIMDGNGRWARNRGMERIAGHQAGVDNVRTIIECARDIGLQHLTLYAFSVENWSRPASEVEGLMLLLEQFLTDQRAHLIDNEIRLRVLGRPGRLPPAVQALLDDTIAATAHFPRWNLNLALNYGARSEMEDAVRALAIQVAAGSLDPQCIDWPLIAHHLYTADIPDPDLVIRTSGEFRVSNFLLLQSAYAEYYFTDTCWPDFGAEQLRAAIAAYQQRERRFGLTSQQINTDSTQ